MPADHDAPLIVALGTSLGDRFELLNQAVKGLEETPGVQVLAASNVYDTTPMGGVAKQRFLNAAVTLRTHLDPEPLLDRLQAVETALGRTRTERWEDRTMDLDLVLWGSRIIHTPRLIVPHPELHRRDFVLAPAVDLAPHAQHPGLNRCLAELLQALPPAPEDCRSVGALTIARNGTTA